MTGKSVADTFEGDAERYNERQYGARFRTLIADRQQLMSQILSEHRGTGGRRLLDVACGPGHLLQAAIGQGYRAVGLDYSMDMLRVARTQTAGQAPLVRSDATRIPSPDGAFDVVTCAGLIEYLPAGEPLFKEIRRVLAPDGIAVVAITNRRSPALVLEPLIDGVRGARLTRRVVRALGLRIDERALGRREYRLRFYSPGEAAELVRGAGLQLSALRFSHLQLLPHPLERFFPRAATATVGVTDRWLGNDRIGGLAECIVTVASNPQR